MRSSRPAAWLLAGVLVVGCSPDASVDSTADVPVVQLGAPGEANRELSDEEVAALGSQAPGYTDADVAFVHGMISHHEQALVMTALVDDRADSDDLKTMAERIEVSQQDEIALMEEWLTARGEGSAEDHADHGDEMAAMMPGMLTVEELEQLTDATGATFDELFLLYMIRHHEGAVMMVEQLLTEGLGGQESAVFQLAQHIEMDQLVEISRMKSMLASDG